jgi:hypothetical protein
MLVIYILEKEEKILPHGKGIGRRQTCSVEAAIEPDFPTPG